MRPGYLAAIAALIATPAFAQTSTTPSLPNVMNSGTPAGGAAPIESQAAHQDWQQMHADREAAWRARMAAFHAAMEARRNRQASEAAGAGTANSQSMTPSVQQASTLPMVNSGRSSMPNVVGPSSASAPSSGAVAAAHRDWQEARQDREQAREERREARREERQARHERREARHEAHHAMRMAHR